MAYKSKVDQAAAGKRHYQKNKVSMKARAVVFKRSVRVRNRNYVTQYKVARGCSRCPMRDPRCLDFHHLGEKNSAIANAVARGWSIEKIQLEMDICIILCANCHRIETSELYIAGIELRCAQGSHKPSRSRFNSDSCNHMSLVQQLRRGSPKP